MFVYEAVGGMQSVAWTDVIQGLVLLVGFIFMYTIQVRHRMLTAMIIHKGVFFLILFVSQCPSVSFGIREQETILANGQHNVFKICEKSLFFGVSVHNWIVTRVVTLN